MAVYDYRLDMANFSTLHKERQIELINMMKGPETLKSSYWGSIFLDDIEPYISMQDFEEIITNFLLNNSKLDANRLLKHMEKLYNYNTKKTIELVKKSNKIALQKIFPVLDKSEEVEEMALRAISKGRKIPALLEKNKFVPKKEIMEKLPPITRLKVLEAFANTKMSDFNVFENFDKDDIEKLLFPSMTRYPNKISTIMNKFNEIQHRGETSTIEISATCPNCGEYNFAISTKIIRSQETFQKTYVGRNIMNSYCPFCYKILEVQPNFKVIDE